MTFPPCQKYRRLAVFLQELSATQQTFRMSHTINYLLY